MNLFLHHMILPTMSMITQQMVGNFLSPPPAQTVQLLTPFNAVKIAALAHPVTIFKGVKAAVGGAVNGIAHAINGGDISRSRISSSISQTINPFYANNPE